MKITHFVLPIFIILSLLCTATAWAETAVIVHPSNNDTLDQQTVNKLFLGKIKSFPSGGSALPINQSAGSEIRTGFEDSVLGKTSSQVKAYWSQLIFTGKANPPKEVASDAEMKQLIASNPSTIGYIDAANVDSTIKVILTF
ncbi:phosphate ABC transporter substrate-binding protein [Teredinibacter haidensis]|uniref:phosphate ABC transporter substrate-binding protein n=1 Tax=Teredinibacter haidensis TaxID=2731755 RepID=UPI000948AABA|nr:phosphate ABC transporter substrate-binding protein [Teredinibacter haidensis]